MDDSFAGCGVSGGMNGDSRFALVTENNLDNILALEVFNVIIKLTLH